MGAVTPTRVGDAVTGLTPERPEQAGAVSDVQQPCSIAARASPTVATPTTATGRRIVGRRRVRGRDDEQAGVDVAGRDHLLHDRAHPDDLPGAGLPRP